MTRKYRLVAMLFLVVCTLCYATFCHAQPALLPVVQQGHSEAVTRIVFAPGGGVMATASGDETVRLWDTAGGQLLAVCAQDGPVEYLAFGRDGQTLVTYGRGLLRFWNARTGRRLAATRLFTNNPPNPNSCISDGVTASTFVYRGQTQVWNMATGTLKQSNDWMPETFQRYGRPLQFTPDGKSLLFQREELEEVNTNVLGARRFKLVTFELVDPQTGQSRRQLPPFEQRADQSTNPVVAFHNAPATGTQANQTNQTSQTNQTNETLWMAQGSEDGSTHLWNLRTGKAYPTLRGNGQPIQLLAFSPDGKRLATASTQSSVDAPGEVAIWDTATAKRLLTLPGKPDRGARALLFSRDGQSLIVATEQQANLSGSAPTAAPRETIPNALTNTPLESSREVNEEERRGDPKAQPQTQVQLWDLVSGKVRSTLEGGLHVTTLALSPEGGLLVAGEEGGGVHTWNLQSGKPFGLFASSRQLYAPSYSPDGSLLTVTGNNGYTQVWDTQTGQLKEVFPTNPEFGANARYLTTEPTFAPDGKSLTYVVSHRGSIETYDLTTHQRRTLYLPDPKAPVPAERIQWAPDGKSLAFSSGDGKTRLLDLASGKITRTLDYTFTGFSEQGSGTDNGRGVQFTPDGKSFVALFESTIRIYDATSGDLRKMVATGRTQDSIHLTADGQMVAAMLDREVQLWEVATGEMKAALKVTDGEYLFSIVLSPDGKQVLTRGHQHLRVWDIATGQVVGTMAIETLPGEAQATLQSFSTVGMAFSTDGKRVAVCLPNHQVALWTVADGKPLPVTAANLAAFPPRFRAPISVQAGQLLLHDPRTGHRLVSLTAIPALTFAEQQRLRQAPDPKLWRDRPFVWIAQTADGYYDSSADIAPYLRWNRDGTLQPADTQSATYHQPDRLKKSLRLEVPAEGI